MLREGSAIAAAPFTIGVEEEFFLVDAENRALRPRAEKVYDAARQSLGDEVQMELNLAQIETGTPVCTTLDELGCHLERLRCAVAVAASDSDTLVVASGTHPFSDWMGQQLTPKQRYEALDSDYQLLAWEQLVSGCHVHIGIGDPEMVISVMDRIRTWLPTLRALGTNSPFWQGVDTGYASYRTQVFDRWHTSGIAPVLGNRATYDDIVASLEAVETIPEASRIYWDARPSTHYPTVELRVADVCMTVDEVMMIAGLGRSLVRTAVREADEGVGVTQPHDALLRAARWHASRYGLASTLMDVCNRRTLPADEEIGRLIAHCRDDLVEHGEYDRVASAVELALKQGTGARRQRETLERLGSHVDVVDAAVLSGETNRPPGGSDPARDDR